MAPRLPRREPGVGEEPAALLAGAGVDAAAAGAEAAEGVVVMVGVGGTGWAACASAFTEDVAMVMRLVVGESEGVGLRR